MVFEQTPAPDSTVPAPPQPEQEAPAPTRLNTARRKLYFHHENVVESLAGKDKQYKAAAKCANSSAHAVKSAEATLAKIRATEAQLNEQLRALQARKLRNKLFPKKAGTEADKLRANLAAVSSDAASAKNDVSRANQKAKADSLLCDSLRADAKTLLASERTRRAILETAYGGQDAGSPAENSIETERDRLARATDRAKDQLAGQKHALSLLKQAGAELTQARSNLWDAQVTNTVDLFSSGAIGLVAGLGSQYKVKIAAKLARSAGRKMERAVELNDKLPIRQLAKVQDGAALAFADIFLDNVVTDLLVRVTIQKAVRSVDSVLVTLSESFEYQSGIVEQLESRVVRYSTDLKRTSDDLVRVRAELFHNADAAA